MAKVTYKYRPPPGLLGPDARDSEPPPPEPTDVAADPAVKVDRWWYESSWDLRHGLDVSAEAEDTVPAELLDELFKPPPPPAPAK